MANATFDRITSRLQQFFRSQGAGKVSVVQPGQLTNLKGIESLRSINSLPNLHQQLTDFVRTRFGIEVGDIFCDGEGKVAILAAANPSFMERIKNSNGNLEVLGHKVVWEMENEQEGKLYLLKNEKKIRLASSPIDIDAADRITSQINELGRAAQAVLTSHFLPETLPILEEIFKANLTLEIRDQAEIAHDSYYSYSTKGEGDPKTCSRKITKLIEMLTRFCNIQVDAKPETEPRKFEPFAIPSRKSIKQRMEELTDRFGVSPDIALLRKFFPDQPLIFFDSWIQINSAALEKFGVFPFLLIAEEAGENISAMHLPAVLDINAANSPEFFTTLGIYIARKLKPLRPLEVNEFFTSLTLRPGINRSIGSIIDEIDAFLAAKKGGAAPDDVILDFLLDSSGQIGCSPLPNYEKIYLVLATSIMSRANDLTLTRSEALANSVGNFIEQGITSERDVSQLIEFIITNTPAIDSPKVVHYFKREITLLESGRRVVYEFDILGDKLAVLLFTYVDGEKILLCNL